jgi:hypothetical protein
MPAAERLGRLVGEGAEFLGQRVQQVDLVARKSAALCFHEDGRLFQRRPPHCRRNA